MPATHPPEAATGCLYTVGHSNHPMAEFLRLLQQHGIEVVVDVRSAPYSRYVPHYNREEVQAALQTAGIKYVFLGKELGGRPDGPEFYDADGYVLYAQLAQSPIFLSGIERIDKGLSSYRIALMCAEENPTGCHRYLLVSRVLAQRGCSVQHIRGDGQVQPEAEVRGEAQPSLFAELEEEAWKSLRPIRRETKET